MKLRELIKRVDKSRPDTDIDLTFLAGECNLPHNYDSFEDVEHPFVSYDLGGWLCTDQVVGWTVIYLGSEPIGLSSKIARKEPTSFEWVSLKAYKKTYNTLKKLLPDLSDENITIMDLDREVGDSYTIEFNSQLLREHMDQAIYENEKVEIVSYDDSFLVNEQGQYMIHLVDIKLPNGVIREVLLSDLKFPFNIK